MREDYHARGRPRPVAIGDQSAAAAGLAFAAARAWRCGWSCNSPSAWSIDGMGSRGSPRWARCCSSFSRALFRASRDSNFDRYLGELSYPIYIGHLWVIWLIGMSMTFQSDLLHLAVVTVLTVLLAIALYAWVDRPVDRWRQRRFAAESVGRAAAHPALHHRRLAS
jgi:peptidoglycan/LPS O-acetylase OafA/YrhL